MPRISKGGKHIFGWTAVSESGSVRIPDEAIREYRLRSEEKVILISGSKTSGGFCVSRKGLLKRSVMGAFFSSYPEWERGTLPEGRCGQYKGRRFGWAIMRPDGTIQIPESALKSLRVHKGDSLLVVRGSRMGCALAVRGRIVETARKYAGSIPRYTADG